MKSVQEICQKAASDFGTIRNRFWVLNISSGLPSTCNSSPPSAAARRWMIREAKYFTGYSHSPVAEGYYKYAKYSVLALPLMTFALGFWQIKRLAWKHELISRYKALQSNPSVLLDFNLAPPEQLPKAYSINPVVIYGHFVHNEEMYIIPRMHEGKKGGYVITPFISDTGDKILVNRGWAPDRLLNPIKRLEANTNKHTYVSGILREMTAKPRWSPPSDPENGIYYWEDIETMAKDVKSQPIYVDANYIPLNPGGYPLGGVSLPKLENNHLQYAITWFTLGTVLSLMSYRFIANKPPPYLKNISQEMLNFRKFIRRRFKK